MRDSSLYRKLGLIRALFDNSKNLSSDKAFDIVKSVMSGDKSILEDGVSFCDQVRNITDEYLCMSFGISRKGLYSKDRSRVFSYPRMIALAMRYVFTTGSADEISHEFKAGDHTSVTYARNKAADMISARWQPEYPIIEGLYLQLKKKASEAGFLVVPDWYEPESILEEIEKVFRMGPFHRGHNRTMWIKEMLEIKR